jgi:hypothetical protein
MVSGVNVVGLTGRAAKADDFVWRVWHVGDTVGVIVYQKPCDKTTKSFGGKMDPRERLEKGRTAAQEGRFEEALDEFIWFHDHALEFVPALRGVRLSFAIAYWLELGKEYPKALATLSEIRDRKAAALFAGDADAALFKDVESINGYLKQENLTYDLFASIDKKFPDLAKRCFSYAVPSIVKSSDFEMARRYIVDTEASLGRFLKDFNKQIEEMRDGPHRDMRFDAFVHIFSQKIQVLVAILRGCCEIELADRIQQMALEGIMNAEALSKVKEILEKGESVDFYATNEV